MAKHNNHRPGSRSNPSKGKESHNKGTQKGDRRGGSIGKGGVYRYPSERYFV